MKKYWYIWAFIGIGIAYLVWDFFIRKEKPTETKDEKDPPAATAANPPATATAGTTAVERVMPSEAKLRQSRLNYLLKAYEVMSKANPSKIGPLDSLAVTPALTRAISVANLRPIAEDGVWGKESSTRAKLLLSETATSAEITNEFLRIRRLVLRIKDALPTPLDLQKMLTLPGESINWMNEAAYVKMVNQPSPTGRNLGGNLNRFDDIFLS